MHARTLAVGAVVHEDAVEDVEAARVVGEDGAAAPGVVVGPIDAAREEGGAVDEEHGAADEALLVAAAVDEGHLVRVEHRLVVQRQVALAGRGADLGAGAALEVELEGVGEDELALQLVRLALGEADAAEAALLVVVRRVVVVGVVAVLVVVVVAVAAEAALLALAGRAGDAVVVVVVAVVPVVAAAPAADVVALLRLVLEDGQRAVLCVVWGWKGREHMSDPIDHTSTTPIPKHHKNAHILHTSNRNARTSSVESWTVKGLKRTSRTRKLRCLSPWWWWCASWAPAAAAALSLLLWLWRWPCASAAGRRRRADDTRAQAVVFSRRVMVPWGARWGGGAGAWCVARSGLAAWSGWWWWR